MGKVRWNIIKDDENVAKTCNAEENAGALKDAYNILRENQREKHSQTK